MYVLEYIPILKPPPFFCELYEFISIFQYGGNRKIIELCFITVVKEGLLLVYQQRPLVAFIRIS